MAQIYEQYWSYTAAFTDLFGFKALTSLRICVDFLDKRGQKPYSTEDYEILQSKVQREINIDLISVRKAINQFVKLGFLLPYLGGYPMETKEFLCAESSAKRKSILSKIVYKYANFDNSMTKPIFSRNRQLNFMLKTLEEMGHISEKELTAMMIVDISKHERGYLTPTELSQYFRTATDGGFVARKYNQISHLKNLLGKLDDLVTMNGNIYFSTDAKRLFGDDLSTKIFIKEPYLQRVYNCELMDESKEIYGSTVAKPMLIGMDKSVLIPAHIKPIQEASDKEIFDANNGLLLPKETGKLFTDGLISFEPDGQVVLSSLLGEEMHQMLSHAHLHRDFLNHDRADYLDYHRHKVFADR